MRRYASHAGLSRMRVDDHFVRCRRGAGAFDGPSCLSLNAAEHTVGDGMRRYASHAGLSRMRVDDHFVRCRRGAGAFDGRSAPMPCGCLLDSRVLSHTY